MADEIKIGNLEISLLKVGSYDCEAYLGDVKVYPSVKTIVVTKFNVTSTSSPTQLCYNSAVSQFSRIEINDVVQPSVVSAYTFSTTGEHTVKYTLKDPTSIGNSAFYNCSNLTTCTIGSGVTSIGDSALRGCTSLTSIVIPNSVTSIGTYAFQGCSGLTSITCNATTAPTIQSSTFQDIKTDGTLYVPIGSSGYDVWMGTGDYYLGKYNWTKVEQ